MLRLNKLPFIPWNTANLLAVLLTASAFLSAPVWAQVPERPASEPHSELLYAPYFQTVIFPGDTFVQLLGINQFDIIAGYHGSDIDPQHPNKGFVLTLPNAFNPENYPASVQTQVIGINNSQNTDGFYVDTAGTNHGFTDINNTFQTVDYPGTPFNQLLGLNNLGQAAGYYADTAGIDHPYIYDSNGGVFLLITIPAATGGAQATGINDAGTVCGFYLDGNSVTHGYLLLNGALKTLDFPNGTSTQALGLNNRGQVVGVWTDAGNLMHGFVYQNGNFQSVDDPNGVGTTTVNGINDRGLIVGFYVDSNGNTDGFVSITRSGEPFGFYN